MGGFFEPGHNFSSLLYKPADNKLGHSFSVVKPILYELKTGFGGYFRVGILNDLLRVP